MVPAVQGMCDHTTCLVQPYRRSHSGGGPPYNYASNMTALSWPMPQGCHSLQSKILWAVAAPRLKSTPKGMLLTAKLSHGA